MHSKKIIGFFAVTTIAAAAITACGGGGGSAGTAHQRYEVKVTASPAALPVNLINDSRAIFGTHNPYYSIIRVDVREGGNNPVTVEGLNCSVDDFDVGALFEPGGGDDYIIEEEVTDENGNVVHTIRKWKLFRNLPVDATAGVATLGLLAGDKAGDVRVTCAAQDPRSGMETSGSTLVHVGYTTGLPAQIDLLATAGVGGELSDGDVAQGNVLDMQIRVIDAALQPVPDPAYENLLVELVPTGSPAEQSASFGTPRLGPLPWGGAVHASTMNGVATVFLTAGDAPGPLCMRVTTDRNDNNVENGIADPLSRPLCVLVAGAEDAALQLVVPPAVFVAGDGGTTAVTATGGKAPYTYVLTNAGLNGLSIDGNGVITIPAGAPTGTHTVGVAVTDDSGNTATGEFSVTVGVTTGGVNIALPQGAQTGFNYTSGGSMAVSANGGKGPYHYMLVGSTASGITLTNLGCETGCNGATIGGALIEVPAGTCQEQKDKDGNVVGSVPSQGSGVMPGSHSVVVRAVDSAGITSDQLIRFTVRNNCASGGFSPN